ncbi:hypothetical protein [Pseudophaeobacter arcticus]|uniref:hypothetical protein n=1 Tax=Pseudophaeobacter arcticus TaxID=385492 RepID=UPI0039E34782
MNQFLTDAMRGVEGSARDAAQKVLWRLFLEISVGLIGLAGFGFITASAFLALSASLGAAWAALSTGLGLLLAAGGCVAIVKKPWSKQHLANAPNAPPIPTATDPAGVAATVAFTAAFVLARYLGDDKPG